MGAENPLGKAHIGQRNVRRARVLLAARLQTSRGEIEARLRDLSRKGALVECDDPLPVGEEVVFARGDTVAPARVAWVGGNRIGIEFLKPIRESEVLIHVAPIRASQPRPQPRYRRPRFSEGLSDYDRKLARLLGASLGVSLIDD